MVYKKKKAEAKKPVGRPVESATKAVGKPIGPDFCPECDSPTTGHEGKNHKYCLVCGWGQ